MGAQTGALSVAQMFINVLGFFLTAWLFHAFVKGKAAHPDLSKTIGMMGYAKFPAFIILTLIGVITPLILLSTGFDPEDPEAAADALGAVCGLVAIIIGLGAVGFFWAIWVHSNAQSVANDVSTGTAFGWLFLAWILVALITGALGFFVSLAVLGI